MFNKYFLLFAAIFVVACALSDQEEFDAFKVKYNKQYSPQEEAQRFKNFQENLQHIRDNNAKYDNGEVSFKEGINQFSDLSPEEFSQHHTGLKQ
ncbi:unnamed protein product [Phyllotreta striolata]|nr:unnamed protein product [Phyllotreta striolata]